MTQDQVYPRYTEVSTLKSGSKGHGTTTEEGAFCRTGPLGPKNENTEV